MIRETWASKPTSVLKKTLTYSLFFKACFRRVLLPQRLLLFLLKTDAEAAVRKCFFKIVILKNFAIFTGKHLCWNLFLIKLQAFRVFPMSIVKLFTIKEQLFIYRPPHLQMFYFILYFQKDVAEYIVVLQCIIISFWNLKLLSFAFSRCTTRCYSLSFIVTRCHSLSLLVTRCTTRCHLLSFVVAHCTNHCQSLSLEK